MILITKLEKPYTDEERENFIVKYNHNQGYEIKETKEALQAWSYSDEEIAEQKKKIVMMSNMTKLDFINALEPFGVNYYEHIVPLLNSNLEAKKQWDLCERVYRFNPLLDELAKGFGITPNQLDKIFGGQ